MNTVTVKRRRLLRVNDRRLSNGDRMMQPEFHRLYLTYPEHVTFELIGGIVYMPSPMGLDHSDYEDECICPFPKVLLPIRGVYRNRRTGICVN